MFLRADFEDLGGYDHLHDLAALESAVAAALETDGWRMARKRAAAAGMEIRDQRRHDVERARVRCNVRLLDCGWRMVIRSVMRKIDQILNQAVRSANLPRW